MPLEFTDYDVWSFHKDEGGSWKWCRRSPEGNVIVEARVALPSMAECQEDARRFGYATQCIAS